jgi:hypothetical protein
MMLFSNTRNTSDFFKKFFASVACAQINKFFILCVADTTAQSYMYMNNIHYDR